MAYTCALFCVYLVELVLGDMWRALPKEAKAAYKPLSTTNAGAVVAVPVAGVKLASYCCSCSPNLVEFADGGSKTSAQFEIVNKMTKEIV